MKTTHIFTCCTILGLLLGNSLTLAQSRIAVSNPTRETFPIEAINVGKDKSSNTQPIPSIKIARTNIFSADKLVIKGIAYGFAGNFEEAAKSFRLAIKLDPNRADAYDNLGNALAEMGHLDEAIKAYSRAITLYPEEAIAASPHNNLGTVLVNKGQWEEGIKYYCRAIKLDPNYSNAYENLRNILVKKGADADFQNIDIRKNPNAFGELGTVLYSKGQLEGALACLRCEVELNPNNPISHSNLGAVLADNNRLKEASQSYQRAIELDPTHAMTYNNLGTSLRRQGRTEEAIQAYRQVVKLPDNPGVPTSAHTLAYDNLGTMLIEKGVIKNNIKNLEEGIAYVRKAKQLDAKYAPAYIDLATGLMVHYVFTDSGGVEEAIALLQKELELEDMPYRSTRTHVMSHYFLGIAYKAKNQLKEAIQEYKLAIQLDANFTDAQKELEETERLLRKQN
ncbi:MAG: tetratricopeptide repeat protein [Rivularia sp. (in: cyanobacteria)]